MAFATTWSDHILPELWMALPAWDTLSCEESAREEVLGSVTRYRTMVWGLADAEEIVRRVSCDEFDGFVAFLSLATGAVYCPCDGGADFVLNSSANLETMGFLFSQWQPSRTYPR